MHAPAAAALSRLMPEVPKVCGPMSAHGFYRQDGEAVAAINGFIRSR
jgi:hypothetical protein